MTFFCRRCMHASICVYIYTPQGAVCAAPRGGSCLRHLETHTHTHTTHTRAILITLNNLTRQILLIDGSAAALCSMMFLCQEIRQPGRNRRIGEPHHQAHTHTTHTRTHTRHTPAILAQTSEITNVSLAILNVGSHCMGNHWITNERDRPTSILKFGKPWYGISCFCVSMRVLCYGTQQVLRTLQMQSSCVGSAWMCLRFFCLAHTNHGNRQEKNTNREAHVFPRPGLDPRKCPPQT